VLIGNALEVKTGFAVKDSFMTPAGSALMSGVEIHATCIGNILHGDWIHRGDLGVELLVVSVTLFTAIIAIGSVPALAGVLTTFGIMLSWAALSYLSFLRGVFIPGHLASVIFMPIALLIVTLLKHRALRKGFAQIKDLLGLHD
jgi:CHASE2 domain-containing sensor protein